VVGTVVTVLTVLTVGVVAVVGDSVVKVVGVLVLSTTHTHMQMYSKVFSNEKYGVVCLFTPQLLLVLIACTEEWPG